MGFLNFANSVYGFLEFCELGCDLLKFSNIGLWGSCILQNWIVGFLHFTKLGCGLLEFYNIGLWVARILLNWFPGFFHFTNWVVGYGGF